MSTTSAEEVIAALRPAPAILVPLVRQADPAILKRRPPSGDWSIHENACHLAAVHPLFFQRLDLMLSEENPAIKSYDPGRDDPADALLQVDLDDALRRFERDRGRLVDRLRQLRPEDWTRTARHIDGKRTADCMTLRFEFLRVRRWPSGARPGR